MLEVTLTLIKSSACFYKHSDKKSPFSAFFLIMNLPYVFCNSAYNFEVANKYN